MANHILCKHCGVELDATMEVCPLCQKPVSDDKPLADRTRTPVFEYPNIKMDPVQKTLFWEIISTILLTAMITTLLVNFIINKRITWSQYPLSISIIVFSYLSVFAFWSQKTLIRLLGGCLLSSALLSVLGCLVGGLEWILRLGLPILLSTNFMVMIFIVLVRKAKNKGINLIAYGFIGASLLCICIETTISLFKFNQVQLLWSVIVATNALMVSMVLLFVQHRLKRGRDLKKTFHI